MSELNSGKEINGKERKEERWDDRTRRLIGDNGAARLASARVLVVGVGGVGGYVVEMLARSGIGFLTLMDADCVSVSNLNRQLIALRDDIGKSKVSMFAERIRQINPDCVVEQREEFLTEEGVEELVGSGQFDMVIDAIDTVAPKVALIAYCLRNHIPILSSMGAGGRLNATKVGITDLWKTENDGLARAVRQRLKKLGLKRPLKVASSTEVPRSTSLIELDQQNKRSSYGTIATIPALFGLHLASEAINLLLKEPKTQSHQ